MIRRDDIEGSKSNEWTLQIIKMNACAAIRSCYVCGWWRVVIWAGRMGTMTQLGCDWLWVAVDHCGWLLGVVDGCGLLWFTVDGFQWLCVVVGSFRSFRVVLDECGWLWVVVFVCGWLQMVAYFSINQKDI